MKNELVRATNHLNISKGQCNGWIEQPEEIKSGIYCWTCKANGKRYIGKSINLRERRATFLRFSEPYAGEHINRARNKFNDAAFWMYSIIEYCDPAQLNESEKSAINQHNVFNKEIGYNLTLGGDGGFGTISTRRKAVKQYTIDGTFVREWDCITDAANYYGCDSVGVISSCCKGEAMTSLGFQWRYADDDRPVEPLEQYKAYKTPIKQYSMNGEFIREFECAMDAARSLGKTCNSDIISCCRGKQRFAQGFQWRYADDKNPVEGIKQKSEPVNKRRVRQYNSNGEFMREFESLTAVYEELGFRITDICTCCKHKGASAFGFQWRYADDDTPVRKTGIKTYKVKIKQFCLDGTFLKEWETASDIEKELGYNSHNIRTCCRGKIKTSAGFIWRYAD